MKKKSLFNRLTIIALVLQAFISTSAFAGYLTINGSSTLTTSIDGDKVQIKGSYNIENQGNEAAQNVFPVFKIGSWTWSGEPKNIAANGKETWAINAKFPRTSLVEPKNINGESNLINKGQFPILVHRYYEDINGVNFSAADVIPLIIEGLSAEELSTIRLPALNGAFKCEGDGSEFMCILDIRNLESNQKNITIKYHTSQDVQVSPAKEEVKLSANEQAFYKSKITNYSGLAGSNYIVFAIMEWNENGLNKFKSITSNILITNKDYSFLVVGAGIAALLLSMMLLYLFVFSRTAKNNTLSKV